MLRKQLLLSPFQRGSTIQTNDISGFSVWYFRVCNNCLVAFTKLHVTSGIYNAMLTYNFHIKNITQNALLKTLLAICLDT